MKVDIRVKNIWRLKKKKKNAYIRNKISTKYIN